MPKVISLDNEWLMKREAIMSSAVKIDDIKGQDDFENAEIVLKKITVHSNGLEKKRKELAKPFNEMAKKIKALADSARVPLEDQKKRIKKILSDFLIEQEKQQQEEIEKQAETLVDNPFAEFMEVAPTITKVQKTMTSSRLVWKFEITNPSAVPRAFCSPDEKKIREYLKEAKDGASIKGVRFYQEQTIQTR